MPSPFRQLHHICLVVHDIDAAVAYYEDLGIGPWQDYSLCCRPRSGSPRGRGRKSNA
jgi:hypothetical protein